MWIITSYPNSKKWTCGPNLMELTYLKVPNVMWPYLYQFSMLKLVHLSSYLLTTTMKSISAEKHSSVVSLLNKGYSHCQIQARMGLGKGTIGRISREVEGDKENHPSGHPSKLSPHDKQSIIHQISSGKLDNAVQATQFINSTISNSVTPQTVRMCWRKLALDQQQRRKSLYSRGLIISNV